MTLQDLFYNPDGAEYSAAGQPARMGGHNLDQLFYNWTTGNRARYKAMELITEDGTEYRAVKKSDVLGPWYILQHVPTRRNTIFIDPPALIETMKAILPEKVRFSSWEHIAPWTKKLEDAGRDLPRYSINLRKEIEEIEDLKEYHHGQDLTLAIEYYSGLTAEYGDQINI